MNDFMILISTSLTLFLILDPIGNVPVFLTVLSKFDGKKRKLIIVREMFIALIILLFFLFFGKYVLNSLHITEPALTMSGGIVLFIIATKMIFQYEIIPVNEIEDAPMIVPLAVPLVSGPSCITMVILYSTKYPDKIFLWMTAIIIAWIPSFIILIFSDLFNKLLGPKILLAVKRLMGMILTTMAVEMFLKGIHEFIKLIQ